MALMKCPECGREISSRATACPNCGCPIHSEEQAALPVETEKYGTEISVIRAKRGRKLKHQIIALMAVMVAIILGIFVFWIFVPQQKESTYTQAIIALENGDYANGRKMLEKIPEYKDAGQILEQLTFETYAYSAIEDLKGILKNPDSLHIYEVSFYESVEDGAAEESETSQGTGSLDEENHPLIIIHYAAQNGFGGNTTGYIVSKYDAEAGKYALLGYTHEREVEELDEDDDDYWLNYLTIALMDEVEETPEIGSVNVDRINKVMKLSAYNVVKIIE